MNNSRHGAEIKTQAPLRIICPELPDFAANEPEVLRAAFRDAPSCTMRQAWLREEEADFAPALVWVGWRVSSLLVFAELSDADIFTRADRLNQRTWELGDAFEIFLRPVGQQAYVEFQVTPNNQRLQLRFADANALQRARATGSLEDVLTPGEAFHSETWVQSEARRWLVYADIPAKSVCNSATTLEGLEWHFSFSRYDYTRGRKEPVISSTSRHAKADFHRQEEWGRMVFQSGT